MLSRRTAHASETNPFFLALAKRRIEGRPTIDLTVSNPTDLAFPYDEDAILSALSDRRSLRYEPEPFGLPQARSAAAATLGAAASQVVLTTSTSEAYSLLFKLLCDPGDDVLIPEPSYPLFEHLAQFDGVHIVPYRLLYDGAWHVDLDSVRRGIGPRTRAIVMVSPNNPTGNYAKRDELVAIAEHGLPIISDEVFAEYGLREVPGRVRSAIDIEGELTFALSGLSKLAALPQMKAGWIAVAGRRERVDEALSRLELLIDSYLSVGAPVQHALSQLIGASEVTRHAIRTRIRANYHRAVAGVAGSAATVLDAEGGWSAVIRLPRVDTETSLALRFLEEHGVFVHPGHFFDFREEPYFVVSLLASELEFARGIAELRKMVDDL